MNIHRPEPDRDRRRRLHVGHFAFMRAVLEGVDLRASWDRYLHVEGDGRDLRLVRATIAWIRDEFAAAARREHRHGTARLVLIDASRIPDAAQRLPTLEDFAESHGLDDFSHDEQVAAYEAEFGRATQRQRRRARVVARQLEALRWLEGLAAQPPRAADPPSAWLHPTLAGHLEAAGIVTLAQLVERINGIGRRWHSGVRALGTGKAERIVRWLRDHEATIGLAIGTHTQRARRQVYAHELAAVVAPATEVRPLEKFIVPAALDGTQGVYRRPASHCRIKAANDLQALFAWLQSKTGLSPEQRARVQARRRSRAPADDDADSPLAWLQALSNTQRAYRKEAERFLLWAVIERGKALSSLTPQDCEAYCAFIADPQPRRRWCGERSRERWSPLWRPFEGPLGPAARRQATTILRNLFQYLVDQAYLMGNPWTPVELPRTPAPRIDAARSFTPEQWRFVEERLDAIEPSSAGHRLRVALLLLYATGLRLSEVVAATADDLRRVEYPADADDAQAVSGWMLSVAGRGARRREVPVPADVVQTLGEYLASRGLARDPAAADNAGAHLLGRARDAAERAPGLASAEALDAKAGIAATTLYDQVKAFFESCAQARRERGDADGAARFAAASTHWLRHTHALHAVAGGMNVEIAQRNLGHASLASTTVYASTPDKRRLQAVEAFWKR